MQSMMPNAYAPGAGHPQAYVQAYTQNKGTLVPGQVIQVQKYTVTVERFLSQGGFAHVYLVRTSTPVNNITQHVLKRMAVADDSMLAEVRKEVDIMRVLRGHPNIVQFLDAAWHRIPNGTYEVFILMEFCAGGGIIDMMNRRLRERLTEGEILQIFVDVCEGLAAMHNLQPALLHRDLKVENILQSSQISFKLCDFGSSTTVLRKPPSSMAEIRALEADLNKHTTLQYRAPEMVDPYLRRPIDEKSDVWALGVLLYKLCYYTTPFEEHGPLAILNVQYKIPPYPVYSNQLNTLIASMLREHGAQRPSVFEILGTVHRMRGTKSLFRYDRPVKQIQPPSSTTDNLITYRSAAQATVMPNPGTVARQKVLDAIAPMRRGRPTAAGVNVQKSGSASTWENPEEPSISTSANTKLPKSTAPSEISNNKDAWELVDFEQSSSQPSGIPKVSHESRRVRPRSTGPWDVVGKSNSPVKGSVDGFGDSFNGSIVPSISNSTAQPPLSKPTQHRSQAAMVSSPKDAFIGLGSAPSGIPVRRRPSEASVKDRTPNVLARKSPSSGVHLSPIQPSVTSLSAEERFPSIEQLEFEGPVSPEPAPQPLRTTPSPSRVSRLGLGLESSKIDYTGGLRADHVLFTDSGGVRSQQVTGTAMRESSRTNQSRNGHNQGTLRELAPISHQPTSPTFAALDRSPGSSHMPMLSRRHRSSVSIKHDLRYQPPEPDATPTKPLPAPPVSPDDWLTGDNVSIVPDQEFTPATARPSKLPAPVHLDNKLPTTSFRPAVAGSTSAFKREFNRQNVDVTSTKSSFVELKSSESLKPLTDTWDSAEHHRDRERSSSDDDEGPEDASPRKSKQAGVNSAALSKRKGRQSSVHELVDLWGSVISSATPNDKPIARNSRRTSGSSDLISLASPSNVRSPVVAQGETEDWRLVSVGLSPQVPTTSPNFVVDSSTAARPRTTPMHATNRPRPQSLFIFPGQASTPQEAISTSTLSPPSRQRTPRRGSISDMVSRYEALGSPIADNLSPIQRAHKPTPIPPSSSTKQPPPKPRSTSPILSRYPAKTSPPASPATSSVLPSEGLREPLGSFLKNKTSPSMLQTPSETSTSIDPRWTFKEGVPRSTSPVKKPSPQPSPTISHNNLTGSRPVLDQSRPTTPPVPYSPSPERPYQGVGRLIDQWQRKTEEAGETSRRTKPPGGPRGVRTPGRSSAI